jgi:hypothetical protein
MIMGEQARILIQGQLSGSCSALTGTGEWQKPVQVALLGRNRAGSPFQAAFMNFVKLCGASELSPETAPERAAKGPIPILGTSAPGPSYLCIHHVCGAMKGAGLAAYLLILLQVVSMSEG